MSLTRKSFIKKSSYSAAAITVLGAGTALATSGSYELHTWKQYSFKIPVGQKVILETIQPLPLNTDFEALLIDTYFEETPFLLLNELTLQSEGVDTKLPKIHFIVILTIAGVPGGAELPSVSWDVEFLPNGDRRYTLTNNHVKELWISNKPSDDGW